MGADLAAGDLVDLDRDPRAQALILLAVPAMLVVSGLITGLIVVASPHEHHREVTAGEELRTACAVPADEPAGQILVQSEGGSPHALRYRR